MRLLIICTSLVVTGVLALGFLPPAVAQQLDITSFPVSAVIRGENVWLRDKPTDNPQIVAYLQRGDAITITGEGRVVGAEEFFPVEVVDTGETGWVRDLFIDPDSIVATVSRVETPVVVEPIPTAEPTKKPARQKETKPAKANKNEQKTPEAAAPNGGEKTPEARKKSRQESTPEASAETLTFSGSESTVTAPFAAPSDVLTVKATHEGDGRFRVVASDQDLGFEQRLFNETGQFEGETTLEVDPDAMLTLDVEANGPWTITIEPAS